MSTIIASSSSSSYNGFSGFVARNDVVLRYDDDDERDLEQEILENSNVNDPLDPITEEEDDEIEIETVTVLSTPDLTDTISPSVINDHVHVCVYVDRNFNDYSLNALLWTLQHLIAASTTFSLLYVFPFIKFIPSPIGPVTRNRVNSLFVDDHLEKVKGKKIKSLRKFMNLCSASQIGVEAMLIEGYPSDDEAKAIVDHVNLQGITKLVIGIAESNLRTGSGRKNSLAFQVLRNAPDCDVMVICQGNDVTHQIIANSDSPIIEEDNQEVGSNNNNINVPRSRSSREFHSHSSGSFRRRLFRIYSAPR